MPRDLLLFDLDGTLVDSARGIASALNLMRVERGGAPLTPDQVKPLVSLGAATLVRRALAEYAGDPAEDVALFRDRLRSIPGDRADLYPGVLSMLDEVRAAGWTSAIVTNKPEGLSRTLLDDMRLTDRFAAIVGGDSAAACKPAPAPVELALMQAQSSAERALFVGDSPIDAGAAAATGIPFLLFTGGYGAAECSAHDVRARFDRHDDLAALIHLLRET